MTPPERPGAPPGTPVDPSSAAGTLPPEMPDREETMAPSGGRSLQALNRLLSRLSPEGAERASVLSILLLGAGDFFLGSEVAITFLYLLPIALGGWLAGRKSGLFLSLLATGTAAAAHYLSGGTADWVPVSVWNGVMLLGTFLVVAALVEALRKVLIRQNELALLDPLTLLANHRAFFRKLDSEIARTGRYGRIFTLAYLDLDNFKEVNDTLGHAEGDRVLKQVARTMRESMRATDLLARVGGDEFGIILPETTFSQADTALRKLRDRLREAMKEGGWPVTASVGAVTFETPTASPDRAFSLVDRLMYRAKREGRDGVEHLLWTGTEEDLPGEGSRP